MKIGLFIFVVYFIIICVCVLLDERTFCVAYIVCVWLMVSPHQLNETFSVGIEVWSELDDTKRAVSEVRICCVYHIHRTVRCAFSLRIFKLHSIAHITF